MGDVSEAETPAHFDRAKVRRDLSDPEVLDEVRRDQIAYYRERAPWYDDVYTCVGDYDRGSALNGQWLEELGGIEAALAAAPLHGDCVELGAGTGFWSERVIGRVERLWMLDAVANVLDIARSRLASRADNAEYQVVDLWHWKPTRVWDCALACFFLEHVPDEVLPNLLRTLHDSLRPGSCVFVAEGAAKIREPQIETRPIGDRAFQVVERRRTPEELRDAFVTAGFSIDVTNTGSGRFVHGLATRDGGRDQPDASR